MATTWREAVTLVGVGTAFGLLLGWFAVGPIGTAFAQRPGGRAVIAPPDFPQTGLPYSPGILVGDTLYLSGQLGRDPTTARLVAGGIEAETRQALANMRTVLRAAGMDFGDVVTVTVFLRNFDDFEAFNRVYREHFPVDPPARATVGVSRLNLDAAIELQMVAARSR